MTIGARRWPHTPDVEPETSVPDDPERFLVS